MKVTRQIVADKFADYLLGSARDSRAGDCALAIANFSGCFPIGRLGLADVAEFGLRWQDCEEFLRRLGYPAKVIVSSE